MYERSFIVYVDTATPGHLQEVALAAASELFDVQAEFDLTDDVSHVPDQPREPRWVTVKSNSIDNAEEAKVYLTACFSPQSTSTEVAVKDLLEILQDAHGLWWRSLEHEFKVRIKLLTQDDENIPALISDQINELTLVIQGSEDAVAYASSYVSELNDCLKNAPTDLLPDDETKIRKEFAEAVEEISEIDCQKYAKYNPYVLRSLLKWLYFVKGIEPSNDDYVLKLVPKKDVSIVLSNSTSNVSLSALDDEVWAATNGTDQLAESKTLEPESLDGYVDVRTPARLYSNDSGQPSTSNGSIVNSGTDFNYNFMESIKTLASAVESATNDKNSTTVEATEMSAYVKSLPLTAQPPYKIDTAEIEYALLRPVILDGSNLAMQHGRNRVFSCRGILLACKYFIERGHRVWAFVPQFRQSQNPENPNKRMQDQYLLDWMETRDLLVYTPSRQIHTGDGRRRITCYDDNMIVQYAHTFGGVMVSKDNYRDVAADHPEWKETVHSRLLMYSWVNDVLMIPVDPLGKGGPGLEEFLRFKPKEVVPQPSKLMTKESCLALLLQIEQVLAAPPPPPETYQPHQSRRWQPYGDRDRYRRRGYVTDHYGQNPLYADYN